MADLRDLIPNIDEQLATDSDVNDDLNKFMEDEVVPVWRGFAPVHDGRYRDSIQITKRAEGGKGQVGATVGYANLVEYGSKNNPKHEPRAKTEAHFNPGERISE